MIRAGRLRLMGFCLVPLVLCGCQREPSGQTITLWHQMLTAERVLLREAVADFEALHPHLKVNVLYKETEELRSGFQAAVQAGVGPELVFGPSDVIGPYQKMGIIQDMTSWWTEDELAVFQPEALIYLRSPTGPSNQLLQIGDRIGNHLALVYNRNLIDRPPATTDEMVQLAKDQTKDTNADGVMDQFGIVWNYTEPFFAVPFLSGFGGWLFEDLDSDRPDLDTPETVAALEFLIALRDEHQVIPANCDYEMADSLFKEGRAAMIINGDWSWGDYLNSKRIDAAVAPLPVVSATGLPMAPMVAPKGYSLNINASGDAADWAMEFVRFMTSAKIERRFMEQLKTLPSRKDLLDDPLIDNDPTLAASAMQMQNGRPMPVIPELRAVWDGMRPAYQMLLGGNLRADEAAREMQATSVKNVALINADVAPTRTADFIRVAGGLIVMGFIIWHRRAFVDLLRDLPRNGLAYALVVPSLLVVFLTIVFPFFFNVVLSFSNMSLTHFRDWQVIGFQNYVDVLKNPTFLTVFVKTVFWTVVNVFCHVAFGLLLAVLLNGPVLGKSVYRVLLIIPWAVPAYITALTWRGMFDYQYGAVNLIAARFGLPIVNWLGEEWAAFAACIIANVWLGIPFMMVIALGGMQGIPQSLYEAARIDRASRWHQFWHITVPMLKPVMVPAITLGTIWTFNNLNVIWLVSNGGQPGDKTHILVSYVYRAVFNLYQYGYGAALSMIIFFILLMFSVLFLERTKAADAI